MKQFNQELRGRLFQYFQNKLTLKKSTKGWWRGDCIYCDGKHTMAIHFHETQLKCFKCDVRVNPFKAIVEMEGLVTFNDAIRFLNLREDFERFERIYRDEVKEVKPISLPEEYQSILVGDSILAKSARTYLKKRGFNITDLGLKGVGFCEEGPYMGYIIFPIYLKGELIFYQGRKFVNHDGPKMMNPNEEDFGIGKTQIIYNEDALMMYRKIRVVESITNCLTIGDTGIASLGKDISPKQYNKIIKSPVESVHILLDPDAYLKGLELGMALCHTKKVKVIKLPEKTDVNDLGKKDTILYEKETPYQTYNDLFRLRLNYKNEGTEHTHKRIRFNSSFGKD